MKFPKGNTIIYGQDHQWHIGIPSDVEFTFDEFIGTNKMLLCAPGYGVNPGTDDYGNGAIVVYLKSESLENSELEGIATDDCTCSDNPNDGLRRCDTCEAAGVLNEIAEIARCGLREIKDREEGNE